LPAGARGGIGAIAMLSVVAIAEIIVKGIIIAEIVTFLFLLNG